MKITATTGNQYELIGEKEGLILYGPCGRLGIVSKIYITPDNRIQVNMVKKLNYFRTEPNIVQKVEGCVFVKTSDSSISLFEEKGKFYVEFGHKRGILKTLSQIELGASLNFIYGVLSEEGVETKKIQKFSTSHPIVEIITT
ncbi:MAG: hypothetical protein E7310_00680 [Clostridiales bacterium]|nr:hypothetical protein [Clostridiales bacterium]